MRRGSLPLHGSRGRRVRVCLQQPPSVTSGSLGMCMAMPLIEEHINAMKDALEALRPRSTSRCASRGLSPRDAQRDALLSELALDLPLTNCHLAVLELRPKSCKHADQNDETACGGHQRNAARLLSSRCATRVYNITTPPSPAHPLVGLSSAHRA